MEDSAKNAKVDGVRHAQAALRLNSIRSSIDALEAKGLLSNLRSDLSLSAKLAERARAGNCYEMTALALRYLNNNHDWHSGPTAMISLTDGNHCFAVVGLEADDWDQAELLVAKPLRDWGDDCYIIDPWANVCCPADQYELEFHCKMFSWSMKGKEIATSVGEFENATLMYQALKQCERDLRLFQTESDGVWN